MDYLMRKGWKGNVRELENAVSRACILSDYTVIEPSHLQDPCDENGPMTLGTTVDGVGSVREMEMKLILDALKSMNGNRTRAATVLGITSRTLRNKIKEYRDLGVAVP
jgi:two-component system response regulator FlrC